MVALTIFLSYTQAFPFFLPDGLYRLLPGDILVDFFWIYLLSVATGIFIYFSTPSLTRLFWKGHKFLTGQGYNYYVQISKPTEETKTSHMRRLLIPSLVALGLSTTFSNTSSFVDQIFVTESCEGLSPLASAVTITMPLFFILMLLACFITVLFAPVWLLENSGLICERKASTGHMTADIEGVGNWYMTRLKGFAGLSTILSYFLIALNMIDWYEFVLASPPETETSLVFYFLPVIVAFAAPFLAIAPISVSYIFYQLSLNKNVNEMKSKCKSESITSIQIDLEELTHRSEVSEQ